MNEQVVMKTSAPTTEAPPPGEPFITKTEIAFRLRISERTVERWMDQGLLPFHKIGKNIYFKWSEIDHRNGKN